MMPFNPYEQLGIDKDASYTDIKAAYKRKAKKHHPDNGGSPYEFDLVCKAVTILRDPSKRRSFDRDGVVDDEPLDNDRGGALQCIEAFLNSVVDKYMQAPTHDFDPRNRDLVAEFREQSKFELTGISVAKLNAEKALVFLRDMKRRFSGDDPEAPIERSFDRKIAGVQADLIEMERAVSMRLLAMQIVGGYRFEFDKPKPATRKRDDPRGLSFENVFGE